MKKKKKNKANTVVWQDHKKPLPLLTPMADGNVNNIQLSSTTWQFLTLLHITLILKPANSLPGEMKTHLHK